MRKTKIICTIGPSCSSESALSQMADAGMNAVRLNFSHGTHESHKKIITTIRKINRQREFRIGIIADIQGPKIRISNLKTPLSLKKGQRIFLNGEKGISVDYPIEDHLKKNDIILIEDGRVKLRVLSVKDGVQCEASEAGVVHPNKSVNIPGLDLHLPFISEKDEKDISFATKNDVDYLALSLVKKENDISGIRKLCRDMPVIAKIETVQSIKNLPAIVRAADAVMVARGDLGVEMPIEKLPAIQYDIIKECNAMSIPVITATHMLRSMIDSPSPTRAEIIDVSNAIFTGTDAVMLSEETAIGKFPIDVVRTIDRVASEVESRVRPRLEEIQRTDIGQIVADAVCRVAQNIKAAAIVSVTETGNTAKILSSRRIQSPIFLFTKDKNIARKHLLTWGVYSYSLKPSPDPVAGSIATLKKNKKLSPGDFVVVTGGILDGQKRTYAEVLRID